MAEVADRSQSGMTDHDDLPYTEEQDKHKPTRGNQLLYHMLLDGEILPCDSGDKYPEILTNTDIFSDRPNSYRWNTAAYPSILSPNSGCACNEYYEAPNISEIHWKKSGYRCVTRDARAKNNGKGSSLLKTPFEVLEHPTAEPQSDYELIEMIGSVSSDLDIEERNSGVLSWIGCDGVGGDEPPTNTKVTYENFPSIHPWSAFCDVTRDYGTQKQGMHFKSVYESSSGHACPAGDHITKNPMIDPNNPCDYVRLSNDMKPSNFTSRKESNIRIVGSSSCYTTLRHDRLHPDQVKTPSALTSIRLLKNGAATPSSKAADSRSTSDNTNPIACLSRKATVIQGEVYSRYNIVKKHMTRRMGRYRNADHLGVPASRRAPYRRCEIVSVKHSKQMNRPYRKELGGRGNSTAEIATGVRSSTLWLNQPAHDGRLPRQKLDFPSDSPNGTTISNGKTNDTNSHLHCASGRHPQPEHSILENINRAPFPTSPSTCFPPALCKGEERLFQDDKPHHRRQLTLPALFHEKQSLNDILTTTSEDSMAGLAFRDDIMEDSSIQEELHGVKTDCTPLDGSSLSMDIIPPSTNPIRNDYTNVSKCENSGINRTRELSSNSDTCIAVAVEADQKHSQCRPVRSSRIYQKTDGASATFGYGDSMISMYEYAEFARPSYRKGMYKCKRTIPSTPYYSIDVPDLPDDFYLNIVDWSSSNLLAYALPNKICLWNGSTFNITELDVLASLDLFIRSGCATSNYGYRASSLDPYEYGASRVSNNDNLNIRFRSSTDSIRPNDAVDICTNDRSRYSPGAFVLHGLGTCFNLDSGPTATTVAPNGNSRSTLETDHFKEQTHQSQHGEPIFVYQHSDPANQRQPESRLEQSRSNTSGEIIIHEDCGYADQESLYQCDLQPEFTTYLPHKEVTCHGDTSFRIDTRGFNQDDESLEFPLSSFEHSPAILDIGGTLGEFSETHHDSSIVLDNELDLQHTRTHFKNVFQGGKRCSDEGNDTWVVEDPDNGGLTSTHVSDIAQSNILDSQYCTNFSSNKEFQSNEKLSRGNNQYCGLGSLPINLPKKNEPECRNGENSPVFKCCQEEYNEYSSEDTLMNRKKMPKPVFPILGTTQYYPQISANEPSIPSILAVLRNDDNVPISNEVTSEMTECNFKETGRNERDLMRTLDASSMNHELYSNDNNLPTIDDDKGDEFRHPLPIINALEQKQKCSEPPSYPSRRKENLCVGLESPGHGKADCVKLYSTDIDYTDSRDIMQLMQASYTTQKRSNERIIQDPEPNYWNPIVKDESLVTCKCSTNELHGTNRNSHNPTDMKQASIFSDTTRLSINHRGDTSTIQQPNNCQRATLKDNSGESAECKSDQQENFFPSNVQCDKLRTPVYNENNGIELMDCPNQFTVRLHEYSARCDSGGNNNSVSNETAKPLTTKDSNQFMARTLSCSSTTTTGNAHDPDDVPHEAYNNEMESFSELNATDVVRSYVGDISIRTAGSAGFRIDEPQERYPINVVRPYVDHVRDESQASPTFLDGDSVCSSNYNMRNSVQHDAQTTITSVSWHEDGINLAIGYSSGHIQIWDIVQSAAVRTILNVHAERIGALAWNGNQLSSGSRDKQVITQDVRIPKHNQSSTRLCLPKNHHLRNSRNTLDHSAKYLATRYRDSSPVPSMTPPILPNYRSFLSSPIFSPFENLCARRSNSVNCLRLSPVNDIETLENQSSNENTNGTEILRKRATELCGDGNMEGGISNTPDEFNLNSVGTINESRMINEKITKDNIQSGMNNSLQSNNMIIHGSHTQEVCGLRWSKDGKFLASGGNDNALIIWRNGYDKKPYLDLRAHTAAVKAIAWSPHQKSIIVSGGGTADRHLRFWDVNTGTEIKNVDTGSQVCNLAWGRETNEVISTHGYSLNQINIWNYDTLKKSSTLYAHSYRVLYLATSPDGTSIVTGAGSEGLRMWKIFPENKPCRISRSKYRDLKFSRSLDYIR